MFADDTVIYLSGKDSEDVTRLVQEDLDVFSRWCCYNKLSVNVRKTKAMMFGNAFTHFNSDVFNVKLCGNEIDKAPKYEYLGIVIDENVTFTDHL